MKFYRVYDEDAMQFVGLKFENPYVARRWAMDNHVRNFTIYTNVTRSELEK